MRTIILAQLFAICSLASKAQAPPIGWQNTIGSDGSDVLRSIRQTSDGRYILGGDCDSNISGDKTEDSFWRQRLLGDKAG